MGLYLKMAAGLLLLVQVFHPTSSQNTTTTPPRTIDQGWLRELIKNTAGAEDAATEEGTDADADGESANGLSSGIASGSMVIYNGVEENMTTTITVPPTSNTNVTSKKNATISAANATSDPATSNKINKTEAQGEHQNSTKTSQTSTTQQTNSTGNSSATTTTTTTTMRMTLAPKSNVTENPTTKLNKKDTGSTNVTGSTITATKTTTTTTTTKTTKTTRPTRPTTTTTTTRPTTTTSTKSTMAIPATSASSPTTTTTAAPTTPGKANNTHKDGAPGSNGERGLASNNQNSKRRVAWAAVLGTAVVVALVGLVAYIILKKKHQKGFSHRKLVEEYPAAPVHRLENGAPLDLNFGVGSSAYYNPGLRGDNIQMTNFPGRR